MIHNVEMLGNDKRGGLRNGRGHRGDDLKRLNTAAVMKHVFHNPGISRSEIAAQLGLSAASVTNLTSELINAKLLRAMPTPVGTQGRPRVPLQVDRRSALVMGIHLGPRTTGVVLMGLDGIERATVLVPHAGKSAEETMELVVAAAQRLLAVHARGVTLLGTGIATGGIVDRETGTIVENPGAGWRDVKVPDLLKGRLPAPVIVDNNARAAAQSELLYGHGQQTDDFVLMVITSDIGSVMVNEGRIRSGFSRTAGQVAHLRVSDEPVLCKCGLTGCLAMMASDDAVTEYAIAAGSRGVANIDDVLALAAQEDPVALEVLKKRNRYVGRAASRLLDIHDPELLVVAGTPAETPAVFGSLVDEVALRAHSGSAAAARVVLSSDHIFSLSLFAAATLVDAVLADPLGIVGFNEHEAVSH